MKELGFGVEGFVFSNEQDRAYKIFSSFQRYRAEKETYQRLLECEVTSLLEFAVPVLLGWNDDLLIIEMTTVQPPYIIDFAMSFLDFPRDFNDEQMEEWWSRVADMYGDRFPRVRALWDELVERCGIYYYDIAPRNVNFGDEG